VAEAVAATVAEKFRGCVPVMLPDEPLSVVVVGAPAMRAALIKLATSSDPHPVAKS
jgi:hypothetical protein